MRNGEHEIVAIAAPTNAGKTTLLAEVGLRINPTPPTFSYDEYDLYPSGSTAMTREYIERKITNWEDPALFDNEAYVRDLVRMKQGLPITLEARSRESMARGEKFKPITPGPLNIVEGVFVLHDPRARRLIDKSFFIDIPVEEMVRRRLARTPEGSTEPWDSHEYINGEMIRGTEMYVLPQRQYADVIVDGMLSTSDQADMVMAEINSTRLR